MVRGRWIGGLAALSVATAVPIGCAESVAEVASQPAAGQPDAQMASVLAAHAALKPKPIETLPPAEARRQPSAADAVTQLRQQKGDVAPEPMPPVGRVEMKLVPGPGGLSIPVRVYTPKGDRPAQGFPVVVYFHGGGWVIADLDTYDASCRALSSKAGAVVVSVDYRRAPEAKFPAAHEDCFAVLQHVATHSADFGGDPARVAVAGESAGGNLATGVCLMAKDRGGKMPVHQLLVYPITNYAFDTPSYQANAAAKPLNKPMMEWFFGHYLNTPADGMNKIVSPLRAADADLKALPPATVVTAEVDPLRSEGVAYAKKLQAAGVDVAARDYPGVTHEFFGMAGVVDKAADAETFATGRLREAFKLPPASAMPAAAAKPMPSSTTAAPIVVVAGVDAAKRVEALTTVRGGPAKGRRDPKLEAVALFDSPAQPVGIAVSKKGRVFLSFPRWADPVVSTVVELRDGQLVPFPDLATNTFDPARPDPSSPADHFVSAQAIVFDAADRLWVLDNGGINFAPNLPGGPKLWCYDVSTGKRVKAIGFPTDVAMKRTALNDVRFDLKRGTEGTAYITDSGVGGIIVVDLASGQSWRHLDGHPSVLPDPTLKQMHEGEPFMQRKLTGEVAAPDFRSDGIALSPDAKTLYYMSVVSRDVFAVPTDLLADRAADGQKVAAAVRKAATKPSGNDGILCDAAGRLYTTEFEENAIRRVDPTTGAAEVIVQDERLIWPDTLAMRGGYLYVTSNQLARQPNYHFGKDLRQPPYALFRIAVGGGQAGEPAE